jgi:tetratricopeptide (TPR) repeat protein
MHLSDLAAAAQLDAEGAARLVCALGMLGALVTEEQAEAEPVDVELAFMRFAERFWPWRFENQDSHGQARTIFLAGARAYAQLAEEAAKRSRLDRRKTQPVELEAGAGIGPPRLETDLLDPEVQYREGHAFFEKGEYRQALPRLELAADCDPQQGLYRAEAAYCRFLIDDAQAAAVLTELEEACRVDPTCGDAYLYAGELAARFGRYEEAESRLRRANRILAPDRRAIDKLRELKIVRDGS